MPRTIITRGDVEKIAAAEDTLLIPEDGDLIGMATLRQSSRGRSKVALPPDSYRDKLVKYIPSEVVAAYLTLDVIVRSSPTDLWLRWLILLFGFIATPLYLWRIQRVRKWIQLLVSTTSFLVWAFALGGPFASLSWYKPLYGAVLLVIFTFFVPLINPGDEQNG